MGVFIPKIYDHLVTPDRIAVTTNMTTAMTEEVFEGKYAVVLCDWSKIYNQPIYVLKRKDKR